MIEMRPVLDDAGGVLLHDVFVNHEWIGSRRTLAQCETAIYNLLERKPHVPQA